VRGSRATPDLVQRLWNWADWARQDPGAPDGSCCNPIWANFIPSKDWDIAWGEQISSDPGAEREIDEADAEAMEVWILQLPLVPRAVLVRRFVLRQSLNWEIVDPAVRALGDLMEQNWKVVATMR